ncbi:phage holin family protein [Bacillus carboniphilus]
MQPLFFYICYEILSILQNSDRVGIPIPGFLHDLVNWMSKYIRRK